MLDGRQRKSDLKKIKTQVLVALLTVLLTTIAVSRDDLSSILGTYKILIASIVLLTVLVLLMAWQISSYENYYINWKIIIPIRCKFYNIKIVKFHSIHWLMVFYKGNPLPKPRPLCPIDNQPLLACDPDHNNFYCQRCPYRKDGKSLKKTYKDLNAKIHNDDLSNIDIVLDDLLNYKGL